MKGKITLLATCLFFAAATHLPAKSLVLTLKNGKLVYYLLGQDVNPMLRFVDGDIVVNTDKYEFSNVKNFYISATDDPSGIEQTIAQHIQHGHNMLILDTESPLPIHVYTLEGQQMQAYTQQSDGKTIINLNPLPQGTYIVTIGESSLKILKK